MPMASPRISVIIPHLNTPALLQKCLASVKSQKLDHGDFEIIVVDNGSAMPLDEAMATAPQARLLTEPNPGPGPARNTGIAAAKARYVACIDADCIAQPGWLQEAVDALDADPSCAVGGEITIAAVDPENLTGIEAYESVFGFRQKMYIEQKHFSVTANLALTTALHAKVGPFGGIAIAEDLDWGRRAQAMGHSTRYIARMHVKHPARADRAALQRKWQRHISHDWHSLTVASGSPLKWRLKALALAASIPLEAVKLLTSPRLAGAGLQSRLRGIAVLTDIRLFRTGEMLRIAQAPPSQDHDFWNRAP